MQRLVQQPETLDDATDHQISDSERLALVPGLAALEGEQVFRCAMCRREIKVRWFVDGNGLLTFNAAPAVDDEVRYRQWLEQNRPPEQEGGSHDS